MWTRIPGRSLEWSAAAAEPVRARSRPCSPPAPRACATACWLISMQPRAGSTFSSAPKMSPVRGGRACGWAAASWIRAFSPKRCRAGPRLRSSRPTRFPHPLWWRSLSAWRGWWARWWSTWAGRPPRRGRRRSSPATSSLLLARADVAAITAARTVVASLGGGPVGAVVRSSRGIGRPERIAALLGVPLIGTLPPVGRVIDEPLDSDSLPRASVRVARGVLDAALAPSVRVA